jgi:hypothetical protein
MEFLISQEGEGERGKGQRRKGKGKTSLLMDDLFMPLNFSLFPSFVV